MIAVLWLIIGFGLLVACAGIVESLERKYPLSIAWPPWARLLLSPLALYILRKHIKAYLNQAPPTTTEVIRFDPSQRRKPDPPDESQPGN